jgi:hypothetical protein
MVRVCCEKILSDGLQNATEEKKVVEDGQEDEETVESARQLSGAETHRKNSN